MASSSLVVHIVQLLLFMRILVFVLWRDDYEGSFFLLVLRTSTIRGGCWYSLGGFWWISSFLPLSNIGKLGYNYGLAPTAVEVLRFRHGWRGGGAKILLFHCSPFISCELTTMALFTTHRPYLPSPLGHHS